MRTAWQPPWKVNDGYSTHSAYDPVGRRIKAANEKGRIDQDLNADSRESAILEAGTTKHRDHTMETRYSTGAWIAAVVCLPVLLMVGPMQAQSGQPMYSYADERGNLVATDRWEDIPERFRGHVKVTEEAGTDPRSVEKRRSPMSAGWSEQALLDLIDRMPPRAIPGLSTYQSVMLIGGFLAMLLFYGGAKLTGSPFLRLLMPWAVGFVVLWTLYAMFISDLSDKVAARSPDKSAGSLVHGFHEQGKSIGDKNQQRLKRLDETTRQ